jgi:hypothetical protein
MVRLLLKRKDLEATAIGEDRAIVVHEFVEAARFFDDLLAWLKVKVVGIRQNDAGAEGFDLFRRKAFDGRQSPDGHEHRHFTTPWGVWRKP